MKIAFDLDNTIINYSGLFGEAALLEGHEGVDGSKNDIKRQMQELSAWPDNWIHIQGRVYGSLIEKVKVLPSLLRLLENLKKSGFDLYIVSHKTRKSLCGRFLLREIAQKWILENGLGAFFSLENTKFFETKKEKTDWISANDIDVVVDDLEDVLDSCKGVHRFHFRPSTPGKHFPVWKWEDVERFLFLRQGKADKISPRAYRFGDKHVVKVFKDAPERFYREKFFLKMFACHPDLSVPELVYSSFPYIVTRFEKEARPLIEFTSGYCKTVINAFEQKEEGVSFRATHSGSSWQEVEKLIEEREAQKYKNLLPGLPELQTKVFNKKKKDAFFQKMFLCFPDWHRKNFMLLENKPFLTDFESAGQDMPARTFLNALHHLGQSLEDEELRELFCCFKEKYGEAFPANVSALIDHNAFEWLLIGAKRLQSSKDAGLRRRLNSHIKTMLDNAALEKEYWSWRQDKLYLLDEPIFQNGL